MSTATDSASTPVRESAWSSNASPEAIAARLKEAKSVVIVTHAKPDGDAIGSALAVARTLAHVGISAELALVAPVPEWALAFIGSTPLTTLASGQSVTTLSGKPWDSPNPDNVVVVDTGSWSQLAELRPWLEARGESTLLIDHHLRGDAGVSASRLIDSTCASCTEVLAPVCSALMGVESASRLPTDVAEMLYLGLATDTGWFRYSSVTPRTLRLAADLIQAGVDHTALYRHIEQQDRAPRWRLLGRALQTLRFERHDRVAIMTLRPEDFSETGATQNDTGGFADMLLTVASVELSVVLVEQPSSPTQAPVTKLSLRSKPGPRAIDVNALASGLGGGGHARAAGAKINAPLDEAVRRLLGAVDELP